MFSGLLGLAGGIGSAGTAQNPGAGQGDSAVAQALAAPINVDVGVNSAGVNLGPRVEIKTFPGLDTSGRAGDINPPLEALKTSGTVGWVVVAFFFLLAFALIIKKG